MTDDTCVVDGCNRVVRSGKATLCNTHYFRQYRHGSTSAHYHEQAKRVTKGRRYLKRSDPTHPLAMANGQVYTHRAVLFDRIGYGPHACHWCGALLSWGGKSAGSLVVDHIDGYGDNNDPDNLVASCQRCNMMRGVRNKQSANAGQWWTGDGADAVLRTLGRVKYEPSLAEVDVLPASA